MKLASLFEGSDGVADAVGYFQDMGDPMEEPTEESIKAFFIDTLADDESELTKAAKKALKTKMPEIIKAILADR